MQIKFSISDNLSGSFISASHHLIKNPNLDDTQVTDKVLKRYIGTIIDNYNSYVAFGAEEEARLTAETATYSARSQYIAAEQLAKQKRDDFTANYSSSIVD